MFQKKRLLAGALALATCVNLVTVGAFAGNERSTSTQTSSAEETVYVNSYGGDSRQVDFSNHWRFNLGSGSEAVDYNDSAWRDVDLPHDYSIEQEYSKSGEAESGYLLGGTGWYRKTFTLDQSWQDKVITVDFGGVYMNATVYLNGHELGFHPYGYTSFAFELPQEHLNYEGDNVLAVKVEHQTPSSRWYSGSGIYRSVHLTVTDPVHVDRNGTYITTPDLKNNRNNPQVKVVTTVANDSQESATVSVKQTIYKGEDAVATIEGQSVTVEAGATKDVEQTTTVANPALWSTDDPNLYTVKTEIVKDGQTVDTYTTEFGFRWTEFNSTTGFELNGVPTRLKGVCMHHDQGALGSEAWYRAIERQVEILKDMGCNAIRVTHNPAAPELIEIANRKGMMIVDEAFDTWTLPKNGNTQDYSKWFNVTIEEDNNILGGETGMTWAEFDIKAMANQDKNSPAVIMYSLGNEIFEGVSYAGYSNYPTIAQNLIDWIKEVDTTRPPTFGDNKLKENWDIANKVADVVAKNGGVIGYNYSTAAHLQTGVSKGWKVYHSETASAVNSRGVYDRKGNRVDVGGDRLLTSYDKSTVGWGAVAADAWWRVLQLDASMGEFVWTGFDYIGEPTPWNGTGTGAVGGWPSPKSSYFGIIDTNGLPKDSYYLYQSMWNEDVTTLHVLPTWDEDDVSKDGNNKVEVVVYSDAPVVKVYLNGEEVGTATSTVTTTAADYTYRTFTSGTGAFSQKSGYESLYATFMVPYAEGTLEVKAFEEDGTTPITDTEGRSVVKSTSGASQLTLSADRDSIVADGDDLSYVTIDVKDAKGNLVNTDDVNVQLSIEGEGAIVGVDNGRQIDHTSYQSLSRNAAAGQLVAIVQSTDKEGSFTVTATADGVTAGSVTVTTTAPEVGEGQDNPVISYDISRYHYVKVGNAPVLPDTVVVTYKDGTTKKLGVTWNDYNEDLIQEVGSFTISGVIDEVNVTTTVNINMLDQVAALLNYSAAVRKDGQVTLPASRPAVLSDGTILNAEFPVEWNVPDDLTATVGTKVVQGTSQVFGEDLTVTASVRVAEGDVTIGNNVASNAAELTQSIPKELQSDTLEAIRDGSTEVDPNLDGGPNESTWSNFDSAQAGSESASIAFRYDTAQYLGQVVLYFATDSYSAALPSDVKMEVSGNGIEWTPLDITKGEETKPHTNVTRIPYTFEPQDAVNFRITVTNKEGDPDSAASSYCVSLTEVELNLAQTSFPINSSDALTGITFNDKPWSASELSARTYSTEALVVDSLDIESGNNAAYTVLPAHNNVVKILTESEDHSKRGTYTINLGAGPSAGDPADDSRDYPYEDTTATAFSEYKGTSTTEGPVIYAVDNNSNTYWHTDYAAGAEDLTNQADKRWIQLTLEEATTLDALRYLPRPTIANGIVTKYRVEVSTTGEDGSWTTVSQGTWAHDSTWKIAVFNKPVEAKFVRLYGVETRGGSGDTPNKFMSCAELRVRMAEDKIDLSDATVTLEKDVFAYTGSAIEPMPTVVLGDKTLKYGVDFAVDYANNVEPGTATLTVRGIVDYSGTVEKTFTIQADADLDVDTVETVSVVTPQNEQPKLPTTVKVTFTDGTSLNCPVVWDTVDTDELATVGNVFTVNGTVTLPGEGKTTQATATVRVSTGNLALAQEGSTLPLAVSFYAPENDSAANINDGSKTFDVSADKKVWSDWERGVFHEAPWVSIVLKEATTVDRVSIGFIDEAASDDPNVAQGNKVRLPASYEIQVYTGTDELDYKTDNVNNGKNWPVMNNDANWTTVATVTKLPTSANYAQMLDTTFTAVETTAVRVVMTPQDQQWVGVDELEIYGPGEKVLSSDFEVTSITADGKDILSKADDKNHITLTVKEGDPMPALAATASNNAKVTITPAADFNGQATIVITSEDGSKTVTYTVSFQVKTEPEPTPTVAPTAQPTDKPEPTAQPTDKPEPTAQPTDKPEPSTAPTQQPGTTEQPVVTQQPGATDKPQATEQPQDGPAETGDTANLIPVVAVLVTAAAALMAVVVVARKRRG